MFPYLLLSQCIYIYCHNLILRGCGCGCRALGPNISRVRSIQLDTWTNPQIQFMKLGGNEKWQKWFAAAAAAGEITSSSSTIRSKYDNETAKQYSEWLRTRVEETLIMEPPTTSSDLATDKKDKQSWFVRLVDGTKKKFAMRNNSHNHHQQQQQQQREPKERDNKSFLERTVKFVTSSDMYIAAYAVCVLAWIVMWAMWKFNHRNSPQKHSMDSTLFSQGLDERDLPTTQQQS